MESSPIPNLDETSSVFSARNSALSELNRTPKYPSLFNETEFLEQNDDEGEHISVRLSSIIPGGFKVWPIQATPFDGRRGRSSTRLPCEGCLYGIWKS
jgi:hypothetical protein